MLKKNFLALIVILLFGNLMFVQAEADKSLKGKTAPEISLENLEGEEVALKDYYGQGPILIAFWATWCKPCIKEIKKFKEILKPYRNREEGDKVQILGISVDDAKNISKVKPFAKRKKFDFPVLLDAEKVAQNAFQVFQVPYTFILDKNGKIVYSHTGFKPGDEKEVEKIIKELIEKG